MNFLVKAPIGPNGLFQWIPCGTIQEALKVAAIVSTMTKAIIYNIHTKQVC